LSLSFGHESSSSQIPSLSSSGFKRLNGHTSTSSHTPSPSRSGHPDVVVVVVPVVALGAVVVVRRTSRDVVEPRPRPVEVVVPLPPRVVVERPLLVVLASVRAAVVEPRFRSSVVENVVTCLPVVLGGAVVVRPPRPAVVVVAPPRDVVDVLPLRLSVVVEAVDVPRCTADVVARAPSVVVVATLPPLVVVVVVTVQSLHTRVAPVTSELVLASTLKFKDYTIFQYRSITIGE